MSGGDWSVTTRARVQFALDSSTALEWHDLLTSGDFKATNALFNTLQDVRVGGRTIPEWCVFDGVSLWQFLPSYIAPAVFRAVEFSAVLGPLIARTRPSVIYAHHASDARSREWHGVIDAIAESSQATVEWIPVAALPRLRAAGRRLGVGRALTGITSRASRRFMEATGGRQTWSARSGRTLLAVTRGRDWVRDRADRNRFRDEQFYPLLPELRSAGWTRFLGIDSPYGTPRQALAKFRSRVTQLDADVAWRAAPADSGARRRARAHFRAVWKELSQHVDWTRAISWEGTALTPAIDRELQWAFTSVLPECAALVAGASDLLAAERPDAVMATYENGPYARAFLIAAARRGLPTVGLQHGTIFPDHYDYMHTRISPGAANPLGFAVPDVTCVWGPVWKGHLTESGHYPPPAVAVTGNWRYDELVRTDQASVRARLRDRLGIASGQTLVAILSSAQGTSRFIQSCLAALPAAAVPVVKLHPSDDSEAVKKELSADRSFGGFYRSDLADLLLASDIVVSQWSTVVAEAVLLDRPVVLVNLERLPGPEIYVDDGICLYADASEDIGPAIAAVLADDAVRSALTSARARFVDRYFYRLDGRAAARVVQTLETAHAAMGRSSATSARPSEELHGVPR